MFVCLLLYLFVCQHDNFRTSKDRIIRLGIGALYKKSRPSSNLGVKNVADFRGPFHGRRERRKERERGGEGG